METGEMMLLWGNIRVFFLYLTTPNRVLASDSAELCHNGWILNHWLWERRDYGFF
jgi:hypothetical protein